MVAVLAELGVLAACLPACLLAVLPTSLILIYFVLALSPGLDVGILVVFMNVGGRRDKHTAPANEAQYATSRETYLRRVFCIVSLLVSVSFSNVLPLCQPRVHPSDVHPSPLDNKIVICFFKRDILMQTYFLCDWA